MATLKNIFSFFACISLTFCLLSCGGDDDDKSSKPVEEVQPNINANPSGIAGADHWEVPRLKNGSSDLFIIHSTDDGVVNYCMEFNKDAVHTRWVAYRYDSYLATTPANKRTDAWAADPALKDFPEVQVAVQYFSPYQRGHILGSAERYYSTQANQQTFYMTNMSPMIGKFNSPYWGCVEDRIRDDWGRNIAKSDIRKRDTLYVVKGGTIDNGQILTKLDVKNAKGETVKMAVPKYYFAALLLKRTNGNMAAIGFIMEHKDYSSQYPDPTKDDLKELAQKSACSIDELEKKTGIDFFCNLPDKLEDELEASYDMSLWVGLK